MGGFFESIPVEGVEKLGMGCLQTSTFRRVSAAAHGAPTDLTAWCMENAVRECLRSDGSGFLYNPLLARRAGPGPEVMRLPKGPPIKLSEIVTQYDWVVQRLDLPDYALAFPLPGSATARLKHVLKESGSVVFHRGFHDSPRPPIPGAVGQVTFGYAVVPWRIDPTILGFGPGRFYAALKQYRVFLMEDKSVVVEVVFIVCPRSEKILDIGGFDPVYGSVRLLDALTFRRTGIVKKVHDTIDQYALGHHGRVHVHMLEGMRDIWEGTNWTVRSAETVQAAKSPRSE